MPNNNIQPYQGPIKKGFDWYDKEQEKTLREKLGDKLFEWLDRKVKRRKKSPPVWRPEGVGVNLLLQFWYNNLYD